MTDTDLPATRGWQVDEAARAKVLADYDFETIRDDKALGKLTDFAAALCETPVALINIVEQHRQHFLVRTGYDGIETPPETSFCGVSMHGGDTMVVTDATRDPRFADNPQVIGEPFIRFYAGVPLKTEEGVPLGSLCVIDTVPHPDGLTALQHQGLVTLAESVMARLRDSRDAAAWRASDNANHRALTESHNRFRVLADSMPQMVWSTLPDGYHDYYNARWYEFTGMPEGSTDGEEWNGMFHPDDQERAWALWRHSLATGEPYQVDYRLRRADGEYRWTLGRALPLRDETGKIVRWFGTCTEVHEQKQASEEREVIAQELSHRIKNIFAVISGLIGFAARANPGFRGISDDLRERVTALGRAHDFVRPHSAQSRPAAAQSSLHGLLDELFRPYQQGEGTRISVIGGDVNIDDRSATPLALLFHELATNATKYGALANDEGRITVEIAPQDDKVCLTWSETGGPEVVGTPDPSGFGSQLIEMSAVRQLGGTVERDWRREGLVVTTCVPLKAFSRT
ncbi:PAS domain-containing protein [Sphingomonas sp. GB1N7]|uniref:PAS domain-containing protein n=1 Tax=Parasphingomonas caseinilytica TaxID=3096158 RepID=UPI002FCC984A